MLRSDWCDHNNTYFVAKERISVTGTNADNRWNKNPTFKNNDLFKSCLTKINNTVINFAEDLDIVLLMFKLLECSENYSVTLGSLWNYYREKVNVDANENNATNYRINNNKTKTSISFEYKTKNPGNTPAENSRLDAEVVVPFKYLSK